MLWRSLAQSTSSRRTAPTRPVVAPPPGRLRRLSQRRPHCFTPWTPCLRALVDAWSGARAASAARQGPSRTRLAGSAPAPGRAAGHDGPPRPRPGRRPGAAGGRAPVGGVRGPDPGPVLRSSESAGGAVIGGLAGARHLLAPTRSLGDGPAAGRPHRSPRDVGAPGLGRGGAEAGSGSRAARQGRAPTAEGTVRATPARFACHSNRTVASAVTAAETSVASGSPWVEAVT